MRQTWFLCAVAAFRWLAVTTGVSVILIGFSAAAGFAGQAILAWDPNAEADLAGYRLYQGTASGCYSPPISIGKTTQYELKNLSPGTTYYFAITAISASGHESAFSDEISYTTPASLDDGANNSKDEPAAPVLASQTAGERVGLTPVFHIADATDPDLGISPAGTRWQITRSRDEVCVLDVWSRSESEGLSVPQGVLDPLESYCARIQHALEDGTATAWSVQTCFQTDRDASDADADGVPDEIGFTGTTDLDRDGTADNLQDNMKRLALPNSTQILGILCEPDADITEASLTEPGSDTADFPYGLIHFKLLIGTPGADVYVTVLLPRPAPAGAGWHQYDPVDLEWEDLSPFAVFSADRRSVTLSLSDGGIGDADGVVNGIVIASSGLALPRTTISSGGSSSGGGGGCFISTSAEYPEGAAVQEWRAPVGGISLLMSGALLCTLPCLRRQGILAWHGRFFWLFQQPKSSRGC